MLIILVQDYITDYEFQEIFKQSRKDLNAMAAWKQKKLKASVGLF